MTKLSDIIARIYCPCGMVHDHDVRKCEACGAELTWVKASAHGPMHGFAHFIDGHWLCVCGCGETWTSKQLA